MKRFVCDTHALVWFFGARHRLSRIAARAFEALGSATEIHVSTVSFWEIALLHEHGHVELSAGFSAWCDAVARQPGIRVEPLFLDDVEAARTFGGLPDPFDRLIAGTALRLGVPLLTRDSRMKQQRQLRVVW